MDAESFERVYDNCQTFTLLCGLLRPQAVRSTAGITFRPCWCRLGSGATPRTCRNRWASRPGDAALSHRGPLSDDTVIGRLQEYLASRLGHPRRCGCWTAATFPSRDGSPWEWPGSIAAGWARWPTARRGCSWPTSARGKGVGGQRAVPARELDLGPGPMCGGGGAGTAAGLPVQDGTGVGAAGAGLGTGPPQGRVGGRGRRLRDVAVLPGGLGGPGDALRAGRSGRHSGLALGAGLDQSGVSGGPGAPANPGSGTGSVAPWSSAAVSCRIRLGER